MLPLVLHPLAAGMVNFRHAEHCNVANTTVLNSTETTSPLGAWALDAGLDGSSRHAKEKNQPTGSRRF